MWNAFWTKVVDGDLAGARLYIHSSRRHQFPSEKGASYFQETAPQMAFCRLNPTALPLAPGQVAYHVRCQRGGQTAETLVILGLDSDGVWRFTSL